MLIGKRKEDVEVEEVKEGRGAARTTVVCGSASNAVVAHAEVCTALMLGCRAPSRRRGCCYPSVLSTTMRVFLAGAAARQAPTESPQTSGNSHTSAIPTLVRRELKFPEVSERPQPFRYLRS